MRFEGKVALVTGAARGLGREIARTLAEEGADVVVADIVHDLPGVPYPLATPAELEATEELVRGLGRRCVAVSCNVAEPAEVNALVQRCVETLGAPDLLVSNAGVMSPGVVGEMSDTQWLTTVEVNLSGFFNCMHAAAPLMLERGSGRIVAVASTLGRQGMAGMANYVASQWAIIGLAKSAAAELGPAGITVNAVCPTFMDTAMLDSEAVGSLLRPDVPSAGAGDVDERLSRMHVLPVARLEPAEVARAVSFLLSDDARFITGTALDVSAGVSIQYAA